MKLWYTNYSPFTSYTTVTPHSDSRSDFSAYMTSHVQYTTYKISACIECATVLRANITCVTCTGEGLFFFLSIWTYLQSYTTNTNNKSKLEAYPWYTIKLYKLQINFCELLQYLYFSVLESIFMATLSVLRAASLAQCCNVCWA